MHKPLIQYSNSKLRMLASPKYDMKQFLSPDSRKYDKGTSVWTSGDRRTFKDIPFDASTRLRYF